MAQRKLRMIHAALDYRDLRVPPSNRLKKLSGTLSDHHSIRINDRWRIIFRWSGKDADDVSVVDYH